MPSAKLNYVELPVADSEASAQFYEKAMGWSMVRFAPVYAGTDGNHSDLGLDADTALKAPLPNVETDDLEGMLAQVEAAGGRIVDPIFAFPGGRRFHFADPDGNIMGIWQRES
ncbi:VOC family protein [Pacificimonas sp. WHA3]|uniref:VOC family protein n=1 Tax=Pacificimonas pallii TaxID=2827236 RepID=A0ABS6SFE1_9SPHN|nr:VOC family protein [Pacificimonas pallii]MBV7257095.1 VOC family protein [Pacificimonas pallii]